MGDKTMLQCRADLRLDLKDSGALWSDPELNRCVERAFSDLSRFLPDEKIFEDSLQFAVTGESVTFPKTGGGNEILSNVDLSGTSAGDTYNPAAQPDVPRPLRYTIKDDDNGMVGLTLIVKGIDRNDQALQEVYHYSKGDDKASDGKKYFKAVHTIEVDQIYYAESGDTLNIGYGAYENVWVYLANSPIKWGSESATDYEGTAVTRNTDFYIDYANGRVKAIAGSNITKEEVCTFAYTKSQIGIDISDLPDLIRVQRVEYPVGDIPQNFVQADTFGKYIVITGGGEAEEQQPLAEDKQYRIYYDAKHNPPGEYCPGTAPTFLEDTVLLAAGAYALYIYALKQEMAAETQLTATATSLGNATGTHSALALALADLKKYLDDNDAADAVSLLTDITAAASLRTAIAEALDQTNAYLDLVASDITDANAVRAKYISGTDYVAGDTEPDILAYLKAGDALLNTVAQGGEGTEVMESYRRYAETVKSALVGAYELDRATYLQNATTRTNAAMVYAQEAAQRIANLRSHIEQSAGYTAIASLFARQAEAILAQISAYLRQASQYAEVAMADLALADRFKAEADERRNEAYSIWRDRKQYIGDFTAGAVRQMPRYKNE